MQFLNSSRCFFAHRKRQVELVLSPVSFSPTSQRHFLLVSHTCSRLFLVSSRVEVTNQPVPLSVCFPADGRERLLPAISSSREPRESFGLPEEWSRHQHLQSGEPTRVNPQEQEPHFHFIVIVFESFTIKVKVKVKSVEILK